MKQMLYNATLFVFSLPYGFYGWRPNHRVTPMPSVMLQADGLKKTRKIMEDHKNNSSQLKRILRALIEMGFIIFLFYSNLLMGEFDKTGNGQKQSFIWVLGDIFTTGNFLIALVSSIIGYLVFEFLRKKL